MALNRKDAVEPCEPRTTQKVEEEGLGRVVTMVGREDGGVAVFATQLLEEVVAQLAGGILDAELVLGGVLEGVETGQVEGRPIVHGQLPDKVFVTKAVAWTKIEIAMGYGKREAGRIHEVGEHHRVDAATNGKQHLLPSGEEVLLSDVC